MDSSLTVVVIQSKPEARERTTWKDGSGWAPPGARAAPGARGGKERGRSGQGGTGGYGMGSWEARAEVSCGSGGAGGQGWVLLGQ